MLKAALFDLDGTLLKLDTREFMEIYLKEVAAAPVADPGRFVQALLASTSTMLQDRNPETLNTEVFWKDFSIRLHDCVGVLKPVMDEFYANKFCKLYKPAWYSPQAREAVQAAVNRGLRIVLATNSVFPLSAIKDRMAWAGVEDLPWEIITSYDVMHFCKPHPEYYLEIADKLRLAPGECMMVGNDMGEDIVAGTLGFYTCLVTDHLIDNGITGFKADWSGSLAEFAAWLPNATLK